MDNPHNMNRSQEALILGKSYLFSPSDKPVLCIPLKFSLLFDLVSLALCSDAVSDLTSRFLIRRQRCQMAHVRKTSTVRGTVMTGKYQKYGAMARCGAPLSSALAVKKTVLKMVWALITMIDQSRWNCDEVRGYSPHNSPKQMCREGKTWLRQPW